MSSNARFTYKNRLFGTRFPDPGRSGSGARAPRCLPWPAVRVRNRPRMVGVSRQTRLGQLVAEKHRTASAGLMRQCGTTPAGQHARPSRTLAGAALAIGGTVPGTVPTGVMQCRQSPARAVPPIDSTIPTGPEPCLRLQARGPAAYPSGPPIGGPHHPPGLAGGTSDRRCHRSSGRSTAAGILAAAHRGDGQHGRMAVSWRLGGAWTRRGSLGARMARGGA